jgi:hypothetical protein
LESWSIEEIRQLIKEIEAELQATSGEFAIGDRPKAAAIVYERCM